jgi:hypothetical protein
VDTHVSVFRGRVINLEPIGARPGFNLKTEGGPVYCFCVRGYLDIPRPGTTVEVRGKWSRAIKGFFEIETVREVGERP